MISSISPCRWEAAATTTTGLSAGFRNRGRAWASWSRRWRNSLGPVWIDDPRFVLPEKDKVYNSIEGLMHHFKIIMEANPRRRNLFRRRRRQRRARFLYCDKARHYRIRVRPPCFIAMGAFHEMIKGYMIADIIPTFGMVNMIGGECDR